jgi:hypothetical protein
MRYIRIIADKEGPNRNNAVILTDKTSATVYADTPSYKQYVEQMIGDQRGQELEDKIGRMSYVSSEAGDMNQNVMNLVKAFSMTQPQQKM